MKSARQEAWNGMNWIRQEKRLAIYLRDGMACVWCSAAIEEGTKLTLDHLVPHARNGGNGERNLVCSCKRCNDSRGKRTQKAFAAAVASYVNHGITAEQILAHVRSCARRSLKPFLQQAKQLIEQRGSAARVLAHLSQPKPDGDKSC